MAAESDYKSRDFWKPQSICALSLASIQKAGSFALTDLEASLRLSSLGSFLFCRSAFYSLNASGSAEPFSVHANIIASNGSQLTLNLPTWQRIWLTQAAGQPFPPESIKVNSGLSCTLRPRLVTSHQVPLVESIQAKQYTASEFATLVKGHAYFEPYQHALHMVERAIEWSSPNQPFSVTISLRHRDTNRLEISRLSEGHVFALGHVAAETALDQHIEAAKRLAAFLLASEEKRKPAFASYLQMYTIRQNTLHRHALYHLCHDATARIVASLRAEQNCSNSDDLVRWIVQGLGPPPAKSAFPQHHTVTLSAIQTLLKKHNSAALNYEEQGALKLLGIM